jgi:hypothetical protein
MLSNRSQELLAQQPRLLGHIPSQEPSDGIAMPPGQHKASAVKGCPARFPRWRSACSKTQCSHRVRQTTCSRRTIGPGGTSSGDFDGGVHVSPLTRVRRLWVMEVTHRRASVTARTLRPSTMVRPVARAGLSPHGGFCPPSGGPCAGPPNDQLRQKWGGSSCTAEPWTGQSEARRDLGGLSSGCPRWITIAC